MPVHSSRFSDTYSTRFKHLKVNRLTAVSVVVCACTVARAWIQAQAAFRAQNCEYLSGFTKPPMTRAAGLQNVHSKYSDRSPEIALMC